MNKNRRKEIANAKDSLEELIELLNNDEDLDFEEMQSNIEMIKDEIEWITGEEQDAFENMPESLQYSERGESMEENVEYLESAQGLLEEASSYCEEKETEEILTAISEAIEELDNIE